MMSRKIRALTLVIAVAFAEAVTAQSTVVELFTSQGCSSCPPADALLAAVQEQYGEDVITLSYHVDYWDYIGWKDPFATKEITQKQYAYATSFRSRQVYTPQAVINGNSHFTGSDQRKMNRALQSNTLTDSNPIALGTIKNTGNTFFANYTIDNPSTAQSVTFVLTLKNRTTAIKRGENRNKTLTNHNIVIDQVTLAVQQEGSIQLSKPSWVSPEDELAIVAYVTRDQVGITSATRKVVASS